MTAYLDNARFETLFSNPIFLTHANYVDCVRDVSQNVTLSFHNSLSKRIIINSQVNKKVKLCDLTIKNLREEMITIINNRDYAAVCTSWIPVKSYYLLFNLWLILKYLVSGDELVLQSTTHIGLSKWLKSLLESGELQFSDNRLNQIYSASEITSWTFKNGNNLTLMSHENRDKQLVKKLYVYSKEEYKRRHKIDSLRGKSKEMFYSQTKVALIDFFYWYRIKVNYRDIEFIDSSIHEDNFYNFYRSYFMSTSFISKALRAEINRLSLCRFGQILFTLSK